MQCRALQRLLPRAGLRLSSENRVYAFEFKLLVEWYLGFTAEARIKRQSSSPDPICDPTTTGSYAVLRAMALLIQPLGDAGESVKSAFVRHSYSAGTHLG